MYKFLTLSLFLFFCIKAYTQDKRDIGLQIGSSYYYGDFNETNPIRNPSIGLGVIFRYNITTFYSIRGSAFYGNLSMNYDSSMYLPGSRVTSFSKTYLGAEIMGEFNFMTLNPVNERKGKFSPFVNLGIGVSQIGGTIIPNIPFGVGVKYTPGQRHTIAVEWRFHKTFNDLIDNYAAPTNNQNVIIHNNDWVSFMGIIYTYRIYNNSNLCPAYK